jgi:hypothetical protein
VEFHNPIRQPSNAPDCVEARAEQRCDRRNNDFLFRHIASPQRLNDSSAIWSKRPFSSRSGSARLWVHGPISLRPNIRHTQDDFRHSAEATDQKRATGSICTTTLPELSQ